VEQVMTKAFKIATACGLAAISFLAWNDTASTQAQAPWCLGSGNPLSFGVNATAYIGLASGASCTFGYGGMGTVQSARITTGAAHGTVRMLTVTMLEYRSKPGFKGTDSFVVTVTGTGPFGSGTSVVTVNATVN
jgi:hypothetical protein